MTASGNIETVDIEDVHYSKQYTYLEQMAKKLFILTLITGLSPSTNKKTELLNHLARELKIFVGLVKTKAELTSDLILI